MKIKEKKKAVSLIVLVITVIVLSILAATVIVSISDTDVISETNKTAFKADMANYKEVFEMYVTKQTLKDLSFDSASLDGKYTANEELFQEILGKVPDKYKDNIAIVEGELAYLTEDETEKEILEALGIRTTKAISKAESFVGCYADTDGDGTADGMIFADLAFGASAVYAIGGSSGLSYLTASYGAKDLEELNDYEITGTYEGKPILKATGDGTERFCVMALTDFTTDDYSRFYWWYSKRDTYMSGVDTDTMVSKWNADEASQNTGPYPDVWGVIQDKVKDGWRLPSGTDWALYAELVEKSTLSGYWTSNGNNGALNGQTNGYLLVFSYDYRAAYMKVRLAIDF